MDQQPWWLIIVAPAATLMAVLIERIFTLLAAGQQVHNETKKEQRQLYVELMKSEVVPVLDFVDRIARATEQMTLDFTSLDISAAPHAYEDLLKDAGIAKGRARSISSSLGDSLDTILKGFADLGYMCQKEEEPAIDPSPAQAKLILDACGVARAEARKAIMTAAETEKSMKQG